MVDYAIKFWTLVLAALRSDRHLSASASSAKSQSKPIQLCLSGFSSRNDAEVHNDASVLGERYWQLAAICHQ